MTTPGLVSELNLYDGFTDTLALSQQKTKTDAGQMACRLVGVIHSFITMSRVITSFLASHAVRKLR